MKEFYFYRPEDSPWELDHNGAHKIKVIIRNPCEEEVLKGHKLLFCEGYSEQEPNQTIKAAFKNLALYKMPEGSELQNLPDYISSDGQIKVDYVVPMNLLPMNFQTFSKGVHCELSRFINETIKLLRWRSNASSPHHPFAHIAFEWTLDNDEWHPFPHSANVFVEQPRGIRKNDDINRKPLNLWLMNFIERHGNKDIKTQEVH